MGNDGTLGEPPSLVAYLAGEHHRSSTDRTGVLVHGPELGIVVNVNLDDLVTSIVCAGWNAPADHLCLLWMSAKEGYM